MRIKRLGFTNIQKDSTITTDFSHLNLQKTQSINSIIIFLNRLKGLLYRAATKALYAIKTSVKTAWIYFSKFVLFSSRKFKTLSHAIYFTLKQRFSGNNEKNQTDFTAKGSRRRGFNFRSKKLTKTILAVSVVLIILIGARTAIQAVKQSRNADDTRIEILGAKAEQDINREFVFPLRNEDGEEVSKLKYTIEKAELRNEIVVKGQRATAVKGRTFLILNIKISNEYDQAIEMNTRDYIRLTMDNRDEEKLAPDIHNDPVEIQAISTKFTRLGFPVNDNSSHLKLHVGEISEDKEKVILNF